MIRRIYRLVSLCSWLGIVYTSPLSAATATATVSYSVSSIAQIAFSGPPGTLTIGTGVAGVGLNNAVDSTTTWALTTNLTSQRVSAQLSSNLPAGLTLNINLTAPSGATSAGSVTVTGASAVNLVTVINNAVASALSVTYTLSATVLAPIGSLSRTVTYTLSS